MRADALQPARIQLNHVDLFGWAIELEGGAGQTVDAERSAWRYGRAAAQAQEHERRSHGELRRGGRRCIHVAVASIERWDYRR
jgi:hypothetical protein